jgi:3-oxoacyl-[acyl-carrier protein] reductase
MPEGAYMITGASRGIGRGIAQRLSGGGALIGAGHLNSRAEIERLVSSAPDRILPLRFDVTDPAAAEEAVKRFMSFSRGRLDGVITCAGMESPHLLLRSDPASIQQLVAVNLLGTIYTVRAALPHLIKTGNAVVITVSSVAASTPDKGQSIYSAAKGGVESFTRAIAVEYAARGLRAVSLRLGIVATDLMLRMAQARISELCRQSLLGRAFTVDEIAATVARLLDDPVFNATVIEIDGGYRRNHG